MGEWAKHDTVAFPVPGGHKSAQSGRHSAGTVSESSRV